MWNLENFLRLTYQMLCACGIDAETVIASNDIYEIFSVLK